MAVQHVNKRFVYIVLIRKYIRNNDDKDRCISKFRMYFKSQSFSTCTKREAIVSQGTDQICLPNTLQ